MNVRIRDKEYDYFRRIQPIRRSYYEGSSITDVSLVANYLAVLLRPRQQFQVPVSMVQKLVLRVMSVREIVLALYMKLIIVKRIILRFPTAPNRNASEPHIIPFQSAVVIPSQRYAVPHCIMTTKTR